LDLFFGDLLSSMTAARSSFRGVFFKNGFDCARSSSIESSTLAVFVENGFEPESSSSTELSSLSGIDLTDRAECEDFKDFGLAGVSKSTKEIVKKLLLK
jgi:hypothetical protein